MVTPLDTAASDDVHDAKRAIELGTADLTVGRLDAAQLDEFAALAEATAGQVAEGHFVEVGAYIGANTEFHRYPVQQTGISALVDAYERLSLPEAMVRALGSLDDVSPHLVQDQSDLVAAYRIGDLTAAKAIITTHTERAKATQRAAIQQAGGQL